MEGGADAAAPGTRAELAAALPQARVIRFGSGYEVWVDRPRPDRRHPEAELPERIFLVDPAGMVTKSRVRLPLAGSR
jgi:hypothetical protein